MDTKISKQSDSLINVRIISSQRKKTVTY